MASTTLAFERKKNQISSKFRGSSSMAALKNFLPKVIFPFNHGSNSTHLSAQRPYRETELLLLILNVADYIFELKITKRF